MIYTKPTNRGVGVVHWGSYDDLNSLYDLIEKFWNDENKMKVVDNESEETINSLL